MVTTASRGRSPYYVIEQAPKACGVDCGACTLAGCDKPAVKVAWWFGERDVWLHGSHLRRFYASLERDREGRESLADRLRADHMARTQAAVNALPGVRAQRGDEPR